MADARHQAIDCMISAGLDLTAEWGNHPGLYRLAVGMLDAIPGDVLARYAKERGALEFVRPFGAPGWADRPLYRLARGRDIVNKRREPFCQAIGPPCPTCHATAPLHCLLDRGHDGDHEHDDGRCPAVTWPQEVTR